MRYNELINSNRSNSFNRITNKFILLVQQKSYSPNNLSRKNCFLSINPGYTRGINFIQFLNKFSMFHDMEYKTQQSYFKISFQRTLPHIHIANYYRQLLYIGCNLSLNFLCIPGIIHDILSKYYLRILNKILKDNQYRRSC